MADQTIRQRRKLVGIDVVHVHRMLKNPVRLPEHVLLSEELYRLGGGAPVPAEEISQDLEGIGPTRAYSVDVAGLATTMPPAPDSSLLSRVGRTLGVAGSGMPHMLGLRRRRPAAAI